jgi:hypothetical protein
MSLPTSGGCAEPHRTYSYYVHTFGPPDKFPGSDKDPKALAKAILTEGKPVPKFISPVGRRI